MNLRNTLTGLALAASSACCTTPAPSPAQPSVACDQRYAFEEGVRAGMQEATYLSDCGHGPQQCAAEVRQQLAAAIARLKEQGCSDADSRYFQAGLQHTRTRVGNGTE